MVFPSNLAFPLIRCAQCGKTVDKVTWWTDSKTWSRIIQVRCHGEVDQMSLQLETLEDFGEEFMRAEGIAFNRVKEITNGE